MIRLLEKVCKIIFDEVLMPTEEVVELEGEYVLILKESFSQDTY